MDYHFEIDSPEELVEFASEFIFIYEKPPEGANPDDPDDPLIGEYGQLVLDNETIIVRVNFNSELLPKNANFSVDFDGWDETDERLALSHGLEMHLPASVFITLTRSWTSEKGYTLAEYSVKAEHE